MTDEIRHVGASFHDSQMFSELQYRAKVVRHGGTDDGLVRSAIR